MQKGCVKKIMCRISLLFLIVLFSVCLFAGCRDSAVKQSEYNKTGNQIHLNSDDERPSSVRFSSFQNPDSTWGFTIFTDSRPFLHYRKIPFKKADKGFASKKDAETVAEIFVRMIKDGVASPVLTRKGLDTLGIIIKK
jgi:hypothetical protein